MKQTSTKNKRLNIWQYQFVITRRLAWWGVISFAVGIPLVLMQPILNGFGIQALTWGAVDAGIAVLGALLTDRRRKKLTAPNDKEILVEETTKLRKLLVLMLPLDSLYVVIGLLLIFTWGRKDAWWRGTGIGIVVQGLFLLGFDWHHWKKIPT